MNEQDKMNGQYVFTSLAISGIAILIAGIQTTIWPGIFGGDLLALGQMSVANFYILTFLCITYIVIEYAVRKHYQKPDNDDEVNAGAK